MNKLLDFIHESHVASLVYKENIDEKLNICLGNVSCDMDSTIGAYIVAYFETHKNEYYKDPGNYEDLYIPVVNCPRGELEARIDIAHHLKKFDIDLSKLVYITDLDMDYYSDNNLLNLTIIDHNKLDINQSKWGKSVSKIIDHHVDTKAYDGKDHLKSKNVVFCGSACSLAVDLYYQHNLQHLLCARICEFFLAAILLDTENLNPSLKGNKWSQIDEDVCVKIFRVMMDTTFTNLRNYKTDLAMNLELGLPLILKKDYKNYEWGDLVAGISVSFNCFHELINTFTVSALKTELINRMTENKLQFYMIISQTYSHGKPLREFMIYYPDETKLTKLRNAFEKHCPFKLKKKKFTGLPTSNFAFYIVQDDSVSRKKIEPVFKQIYEENLL
jgi:inorganic pyrophosphatase/exopolyphosphatase